MKKAELLAPVGKMENAIAAVENGADALFVGGKLFNARQYADNFSNEELEEIVKYAKLRGVRVYVTVNILIKETELSDAYAYLKYLDQIGVHAIIVQDLGIAALAREHFPNLRLHASTQMSAHSVEDVMFLKSLGFKRVVLARELNLKEIKTIIDTCDIEIETFVHGALCYSYSGQCLMSSLIGGRSGNRGRCAQPCRMKYSLMDENRTLVKDAYLLSLKDICSVEFLPELLACGVHSLKVEGRMKSPEYVASVIKTYRKYVDLAASGESYKVSDEDVDILKGVFNRGGFSKGYYYEKGSKAMLTPVSPRHIGLKAGKVTQYIPKTGMTTILLERDLAPGDGLEIIRKGKESVGTGISKACQKGTTIKCQLNKFVEVGSEVYLTKNHNLLKVLRATYQKPQRRIPISVHVYGRIGQPIEISLICGEKVVNYQGTHLEAATNAPLSKEAVIKQLGKLGSTSFEMTDYSIVWDEEGYLPVSQINEMRRQAVSLLEEALLEVPKHEYPEEMPRHEVSLKDQDKKWRVHVTNKEQLMACLERAEIEAVYWEWYYNDERAKEALELCKAHQKAFYLVLPQIIKEKTMDQYKVQILAWQETDLTGYVVRTTGSYELLKGTNKQIVLDYNMNIMNNEVIHLWEALGAERTTISLELTNEEIEPLQGNLEKVVYGYFPVMTSQQCVLRHTNNCQKTCKEKKRFEIKDRTDTKWAVETDCEACVMQLISHEPLAYKKADVVRHEMPMTLRLHFTHENEAQTKQVLEAYLENGQGKALKGTTFKGVL